MITIFETTEKDRILFHFNKASIPDKTIPAWTVKYKGATYYVNHLESNVGFSTKETPDNSHTQASIQFRGVLKITEEDGKSTAYIN